MIDYRDYSYSMVRFIATLMIIFCHTFQVIGFTLKYSKILGGIGDFLSTGVQIFLIMSGLLYGSKENLFEKEKPLHFFFRNSKKILLDYYIYSLLIILPVYSTLDWNGLYSFCVRLFRIITFSNGLFWGVHHLWFIPYIILCYLITPILYDIRNIAKTKLQMWLILLSLIFVFEIIEVAYKSYFIATWINCYAFGFFLPRLIKNWDSTRKQSLTIRCTVLFIISCCIWAVMSYLVKLHYINGKYTLKFFDYAINYTRSFNALFIIMATVMLYRHSFKNATPPPKMQKFLKFTDKYSYDIYIVHMIYVKGILSLLDVTNSYVFNTFIMLVAVMFSAIILHIVCRNVDFFLQKLRFEKLSEVNT